MPIWLWVIMGLVLAFGFVVFWGAPYVPSKKRELQRVFAELYPLTSRDVLVDIGSGDGIVLRQAAARGARAVGYELNPILVVISRCISRTEPRVTTLLADFWRVQLPDDTTVVYTFGESRDITKMANKVVGEAQRLQKTLAFISYGFAVPGMEPEKTLGAHHLYLVHPLQGGEA